MDFTSDKIEYESDFGTSNARTADNSWAVEYIEDNMTKFHITKKAICMAAWNYECSKYASKNITPVAFHNALRTIPGTRDVCTDFLSFIFNPKISPWKSILQDGVKWDKPNKAKVPVCVIPVTKDTPIQTLISLVVTARECQENEYMVYMWNELVKNGFSEVEALYVSVYYGLAKDNDIILAKERNHSPFIVGEKLDLKRLKDAKPRTDPAKKFAATYSNFASIFYDKDWGYYWNNSPKKLPIYQILNNNLKYDGSFSKHFKNLNGSDVLSQGRAPTLQRIIELKKEILAA